MPGEGKTHATINRDLGLPKDEPTKAVSAFLKGRVFYCSFGHDGRIFRDPRILQFYLDGIQYALGDLEADATPSAKLDPQPKPALPPEKK